jgi:hypothetical protein
MVFHDFDVCGDGRRTRIRALYERLLFTRDRATAMSLRQLLRAELEETRACGATARSVETCADCLERS